MVSKFGRQNGRQVSKTQRDEVQPDDTSDTTVHSDRYVEIFSVKSENTKRYAPGFGTGDRRSSNPGYADFDAQTSSNGDFTGKFRWVLYESDDQEVPIAISQTYDASALRNSVSESLTDKQLHPGKVPVGSQDRVLVLEAKADSNSDGNTYDASASNADSGIPYSLIRK